MKEKGTVRSKQVDGSRHVDWAQIIESGLSHNTNLTLFLILWGGFRISLRATQSHTTESKGRTDIQLQEAEVILLRGKSLSSVSQKVNSSSFISIYRLVSHRWILLPEAPHPGSLTRSWAPGPTCSGLGWLCWEKAWSRGWSWALKPPSLYVHSALKIL